MSKKTAQYIRLGVGILLSVLLILTGILLISACVSVYRLGNRPFTTENISAAFARIRIPVYITLIAVIAGGILHLVLPSDKPKIKARIQRKATLRRLQRRLAPSELPEALTKEKKRLTVLRALAGVLSLAIALPAVIYVCNPAHYGADYNASVIAACLWILPCSLGVIALCVAYLFLEDASIKRQLELVKTALAQSGSGTAQAPTTPAVPPKKRTLPVLRLAILAVALVFVVIGIFNGGMDDVLAKAINICTECIGLG